MIRELRYYSRIAVGFAKWARSPAVGDPRTYIQGMLQNREQNFLTLLRRGVFDNPSNPYNALFEWAGCTFGDLEALVRKDGLEATLMALYNQGVYLTHDEFKGKVPVVRGGRKMEVDNAKLANPAVKGIMELCSSGSRSRGTVSTRSLEYQHHREAQERVLMADMELEKRALLTLSSTLPSAGGLRRVVNSRRSGHPVEKWFAQSSPLHYRVLTRMFVINLAMRGMRVVGPEYLPHNDFSPVAQYIARRKREGVPIFMRGGVSRAVRVAGAALELGLDISGTLVSTGGEALTDEKRAVIESAGCEVHSRYTITEFGPIGVSCRSMTGNCVHIARDSVAVISRRKKAPLTEIELESLLFTALLPCAANIMVNVEMDDAGELGPATCGCELQKMGFTQQVDKIFSYGKLTGFGMSLVGGDVLQILEKFLPQKFGGVPSDYQLVEREGHNQTEYELRVNPRVGVRSPDAVRSYFLSELKGLWGGSSAISRWTHGDNIKVSIAEPFPGRTGKVLSLHLLGSPDK